MKYTQFKRLDSAKWEDSDVWRLYSREDRRMSTKRVLMIQLCFEIGEEHKLPSRLLRSRAVPYLA